MQDSAGTFSKTFFPGLDTIIDANGVGGFIIYITCIIVWKLGGFCFFFFLSTLVRVD